MGSQTWPASALCVLVMVACSGERPAQRPGADTSTAVAVAPDTQVPAAAPDPTTGRLGTLRDSLTRLPNDPRVPDWLWETGTLMRDRFNFINGADTLARFAREHPDEFFYDESYAGWFYSRHHFRELVARFPGHERADDAAFRLADPLDGGECEGDVLCYIEGRDNVRGLINFLARFPASEYTGEAVRRANVAFTTRLADEFGGPGDDGMLDAPAVGRLLDEYAATVAGLPAPVRERAQAAIDSARLMLDSLSRARP